MKKCILTCSGMVFSALMVKDLAAAMPVHYLTDPELYPNMIRYKFSGKNPFAVYIAKELQKTGLELFLFVSQENDAQKMEDFVLAITPEAIRKYRICDLISFFDKNKEAKNND